MQTKMAFLMPRNWWFVAVAAEVVRDVIVTGNEVPRTRIGAAVGKERAAKPNRRLRTNRELL
jgi:hypothetical protein